MYRIKVFNGDEEVLRDRIYLAHIDLDDPDSEDLLNRWLLALIRQAKVMGGRTLKDPRLELWNAKTQEKALDWLLINDV